MTHKLPAFTIKQQRCSTPSVVQDANGLGKPGSGVIIYVLRRGRVRLEDWMVSFSLPHPDPNKTTLQRGLGGEKGLLFPFIFSCVFCLCLALL